MSDTLEVNVTVLAAEVIAEDRRLESRESEASVALMHYRWHWTLDESNPKRVSLRAYAEAVGRDYRRIASYARGYERWLILSRSDAIYSITPTEVLIRATMSEDTEAATEAVAIAHKESFTSANQYHRPEVRKVRAKARQQAKEKGTTVKDEAPQVAEQELQEKEEEHRRQQQEQQDQIKKLRSELATLKKEYKALQRSPDKLNEKIATLEQQIKDLKAQKEEADRKLLIIARQKEAELKEVKKKLDVSEERKRGLEDHIKSFGELRRKNAVDRIIRAASTLLSVDPKAVVHSKFRGHFGSEYILSAHYSLIQYIIPWLQAYAEEIKRTIDIIEDPEKHPVVEGEVVHFSVARGLKKRQKKDQE